MAISKVSQYNSTPTTVADYQAQNAHLQAMINQANGSTSILKQINISTIPSIAQGTYISVGGTLYIVDTEDYTILGSVSNGNNYIALAVSGENLTATWVQDISSYAWNSIYNYYSNGTNILLPYVISFITNNYLIGTFQYAFKANQDLLTVSDVDFKTIAIKGNKLIFTPTDVIKFSFNSNSSFIGGLTFDGTNLISCDNSTDKIYIHDGITSTILSSFDAPSINISGLAFDGTNLISCDRSTDKIYIHDGITSTILSSFDAPNSNVGGLTFDGTNLISCDNSTDKIYIHDGITSTILSSFDAPSTIGTLTFDGTNLISSSTDKIYIHAGITSTILSSFNTPNAPLLNLSGLAFDGSNLISSANNTNKIYIHLSNITI